MYLITFTVMIHGEPEDYVFVNSKDELIDWLKQATRPESYFDDIKVYKVNSIEWQLCEDGTIEIDD